eukprot:TRINITY_DN4953_c0_g2_i2.p1 TRINITY_DN4953_c0_g2~~TRINITY_DN4953_c0_g2_i2.p1  ORF type:complete len:1348 (-),score=234.64 TRINITY_DN4953_c0_g2_i2:238-4281(-)
MGYYQLFCVSIIAVVSLSSMAKTEIIDSFPATIGLNGALFSQEVVLAQSFLNCDSGSLESVCIISTRKEIFGNLTIIEPKAVITLQNSGSIECLVPGCVIRMEILTLTLAAGSLIQSNGIIIDALRVEVYVNATITTDGTSYKDSLFDPGIGASHAGFGSSCFPIDSQIPPYGSATGTCDYDEQGRAASSIEGKILGGGYISISATEEVVVDGVVSSNGAHSEDFPTGGGGSGGCVNIQTTRLVGEGNVTASGGNGGQPKEAVDGGGGGSGGRIMISSPLSDGNIKFDVSGGFSFCEIPITGAAGTIYTRSTKTLEIDNLDKAVPSLTDYAENNLSVASLVVKRYSRVVILTAGNRFSASKSILVSDYAQIICSTIATLAADTVTIRKSSTINCPYIMVDAKNFTLDRSSSIEQNEVRLRLSDRAEIGGYLRTDGVFDVSSQMNGILVVNVTSSGLISSTFIHIHASVLWVDGRMSNLGTYCPDRCEDFQIPQDYGMDFEITHYVHIGKKGSLISGFLVMYTEEVFNYGYISGSGTGCTSDKGLGKGLAEYSGPGGGAGYGGPGGNGTSLPDIGSNAGGSPYGLDSDPFCPGSGGGSTSRYSGGSGGGVLIVHARKRILNDNFLISDGRPGSTGDLPGGGGAGGTIQLHTPLIQGVGSVSASGGSGAQELGGGGGGGRIRLYLVSGESDQLFANSSSAFTFSPSGLKVSGGKGAQSGSTGSIFSTPCAPGYYGVFCLPCPVGEYQPANASTSCIRCQNAPLHSYYSNTGVTTSNCPYKCDPGHRYPTCITAFDEFIDDVGGEKLAFGVAWGLLSLISTAWVLYARDQEESKNPFYVTWKEWYLTSANDPDSNQQSLLLQPPGSDSEVPSGFVSYRVYDETLAEDRSLVPKDLKNHLARLYFLGENSYSFPWRLQMFFDEHGLKEKRAVLDKEYQIFTHLCNEHAAWKTWEGLVYFLLLTAYPLAHIFQSWRRGVHAQYLEEFVREIYNDSFLKACRSKAHLSPMKFGHSSDFSLAYIDILLSDVSTTLTTGCPRLPMVIVLCGNGTYLSPFQVNVDDLYSASIFHKCDYVVWTSFIINLNNLLRQVSTDYNGTLHDVLNYIDDQNTNVFHVYSIHVQIGRYSLSTEGRVPLALSIVDLAASVDSVNVPNFKPYINTAQGQGVQVGGPASLIEDEKRAGLVRGHIISFLTMLCMKNRAVSDYALKGKVKFLLRVVLLLLVAVDMGAVLIALDDIFHLDRLCFFLAILLFPGSLIIAPSAGFMATVTMDRWHLRYFSTWNTIASAAAIFATLYLIGGDDVNSPVLILFLLLIVKYISSSVTSHLLAAVEHVDQTVATQFDEVATPQQQP